MKTDTRLKVLNYFAKRIPKVKKKGFLELNKVFIKMLIDLVNKCIFSKPGFIILLANSYKQKNG